MPKDLSGGAALPRTPRYADLVGLGQHAIGAAIDSSAALSAGIEAIGREIVQYGQAAFAATGKTARDLLSAHTVEDVVRLQNDYLQRSFSGAVERSGKLSQLGWSLLSGTVSAWGERTIR